MADGLPKSLLTINPQNKYQKGVSKTVGTESVSGPSQASKPAPSVEYSQSHLGEHEIKTVTDGKTKVQYDANDDVSAGRRRDYFQQHGKWPPCINPDCRSYGRPHPNCLCYGAGSAEKFMGLAEGGEVCAQKMKHHESCEYSNGGFVESPQVTLDHAAIHHGLLGALKDIGHSKMNEKYEKHFDKLNMHLDNGDHEKAENHLSGHPLSGSVPKSHLKPILDRLSSPLALREKNPEALRSSVDYLSSSIKGGSKLDFHLKNLIGAQKSENIDPDEKSREDLKEHLRHIQGNPESLLDIGGDLSHYLPEHGAQLGALAGNAINHLNSIKPLQSKSNPLDELTPVDKASKAKYDRHLDIAQNPLIILQHVKDGTLVPSDMSTLITLYPGLHKTLVDKVGEQLILAKDKGIEIPYKQRQTLSLLLGQPLDSTMTQQSMAEIMKSAGPQQIQMQNKNKPKKASGVELKQINKANDIYPTSLQQRQLDKKD